MKTSGVKPPTTPNKHGAEAPTSDRTGQTEKTGLLWLRIALITLAYILAAMAGQLLAAPDTQASLLWPAAGLALALLLVWGPHLWPGVWLGSFLYHYGLSAPPLDGEIIAALIATGATLQALLGAHLTRHLLNAAAPLTRERDVVRFLLLAGPLSCVVSASVASAAVYLAGEMAAAQAVTMWFLWWAGDTLGVLLFAPLVLALPIAGAILPRSTLRMALPLLITAALLVSGNHGLNRIEESQARVETAKLMEEAYDNGFSLLSYATAPLLGVERFFTASEQVTQEEYHAFASYFARQPWLLSVDWAPWVRKDERAAFEASLRRNGFTGTGLTDLNVMGEPVPSPERDEYFPVMLTEPLQANARILGLDHAFEAPRREAMMRARDSGQIAVTAMLPLLRTTQRAFIAYTPVYHAGFRAEQAAVEERRHALRGYVVGVFGIRQLFATLDSIASTHQLLYRVTDITSAESRQVLLETLPADTIPTWRRTIRFADRLWQLEMKPAVAIWQSGASLPSRFYLGFSVLAAFLIAFATLGAAGRNAATAVEVIERTADLARELHARRAAEEEVRRLNRDLEQKVEERTKALEALHYTEEELSAIVDHLPYALISIDSHGIVQSANPAIEAVLGYRPEELVGRNVSVLMPEPDRSQHDSYISRYLLTGEAHIIHTDREVMGLHKDGRLIPLELAVNEYEVQSERFFVGSLYDISERKLFIDELTSARLDAEQASRAKSAFLATMSHEIRTPMNGVIGLVDVLAHSNLSDYQAELIKTIRESATTLLNIIDDILDFSKIDAGRMTLEHNPVNVPDLVEGLCTALHPDAVNKGVELSLFVSPDIPHRVLTDSMRLRQVLWNLAGNAIKFSANQTQRKGRVAIRVAIARTEPFCLSFRIKDNGIGMTQETLEKLFTPFTQAEASTTRRFGGTGLGLAIASRLIELMHGEVTVASKPDAGTTFTVTLPFDVAGEQPPQPRQALTGITCIMVQDPGYNDADMRAYLEYAGAHVQVAQSTAIAAQLAGDAYPPAVVIQYAGTGPIAADTALEGVPNLHHLLLTCGRRQRARLESTALVSLDYPILRHQALVTAVALAVGRASPEPNHDLVPSEFPDEASPPSIAEARAQGRLILIAEDDKLNQRVIMQQLSLLGYAAEIAENGDDALQMWRKGDYALLLTDLYMPVMDGYDLARSIRREEHGESRIPILAFTANALSGEADRALEAGMDEYMTKPVQLRMLREMLEQWLPAAKNSATSAPSAQLTQRMTPLDVTVLHDMVGDDPGIVLGLLSDYLTSVRQLAGELHSAYIKGDIQQICAITHKLKSSSRVVGALAMGELCAQLEKAGKGVNRTAIDEAMPKFEAAVKEIEAELIRLLDRE